jgi:hypothetical protein
MSGTLESQGFPLTLSLSKGERKAFFNRLLAATEAPQAGHGRRGKALKSGSRFSRYALRPSFASSDM